MRLAPLVAFGAALAAAADLPVKQVILYKNGIAYVHRSGEVQSGQTPRLEFKAEEMDDVLKSLTLASSGGARILRIRYDSSEPLEEKLNQFPFANGKAMPMSAFLDALRGARVEVSAGAQNIAGLVVAARESAAEANRPRREELTLLLDTGELRTFDMSGLTSIRFSDPQLQTQMKDFLATLARARSKDRRAVYIDLADQKGAKLQAGYVVPAPAWKSSYRLAFTDAAEPTLEGWAIVDNTSGEDWSAITLALVSGKPVSFVTNLYQPRYIERAEAELPEDAAVRPQLHGGVVENESAAGVAGGVIGGVIGARQKTAPPPPPPPAAFAAPMRVRGAEMRDAAVSESVVVSSDIAAAAQGRTAGELFEYRFDSPVTIRKDESAMIPFLQQEIAARKLLIFTEDGSEHPRNAAELTNTSGKTLDGGPVTIFDANAYAGEALMETLKAGDKRLISYAVDLGSIVTTAFGQHSETVREVHVRRGVLTARVAQRFTKTYTVRNSDQKPKSILIEHPVLRGRELVDLKPLETTATAYRFEVKLAASATEKLPVTEETVLERTYALANSTSEFLLSFVQNKQLGDAARKQLERVAAQKRDVAALDRDLQSAEREREEIARDEQRMRENIASLNRVSGQQDQVQNYARQLAAAETQIAALRDRAGELRKKRDAAQAALNAMMDALEF